MKTEFALQSTGPFSWYRKFNTFVRGYASYNEHLYRDEEFAKLVNDNLSQKLNINFIRELNGFYSIILTKENQIQIISDKLGSFPLLYSVDGSMITDNVYYHRALLDGSKKELDKTAILEILLSGYSCNNRTTYSNIRYMQLASIVTLSETEHSSMIYYSHSHQYDHMTPYGEHYNRFTATSVHIFQRLINSLNGQTAVLPLSGGYDSRYIACMLKSLGYNNVICFTYGKRDSYEVSYSKIVAEKLGYQWYFIEYTDNAWNAVLSEDFIRYFDYAHNASATSHIQEYIALDYLVQNHLIPENSIFIPGFCGDFPAGSFVPSKNDFDNIELSKAGLATYEWNLHYDFIARKERYMADIINDIQKGNDPVNVKSTDDFISGNESWVTRHKLQRFVINALRVYEYFGFEWRMPLWDDEFMQFWYAVPNQYREGKKLYIDWLFHELFIKYNVDLKKPNIQNIKHFHKRKLKGILKRMVIFIFFITGVDLLRKGDINGFHHPSRILYRQIHNKAFIDMSDIRINSVLSMWLCEKWYGYKNIKTILRGKVY